MVFRSEKHTNNNINDFKVVSVGIVFAAVIFSYNYFVELNQNKKWYRTLFNIIPFTNVYVHRTILEDNTLYIEGEMVKLRCTFSSLVAYIYDEHGLGYRIPLNDKVEASKNKNSNRPASKKAQKWGPWSITIPEDLRDIKFTSYEVFAYHIDCPNKEQEKQVNSFVEGPWSNYELKD